MASNEFSWQEQLEVAAQVVAAIAVGGYISHRAHLNKLGVSASTPLSVERYLAEAWYVVSESLGLLLTISLWPLALLLLGSVVVAFLARRNWLPKVPSWVARVKPDSESFPVPLALLLGLIFILRHVCLAPMDRPFSVAVGPLSAENLVTQTPTEAATVYALAMLTWLLCAGVVTALVPESRSRDKVWWAWLGCRAMLPLGVVALFIHFGLAVHSTTYPSVEVRHGKDSAVEKLSGALVLESSESLTIWSTSQGSGVLTYIPRDAVQSIRFGPDINVLARARDEATRHPGVPPAPWNDFSTTRRTISAPFSFPVQLEPAPVSSSTGGQ